VSTTDGTLDEPGASADDLAGEYVLGTLSSDETASVQLRLPRDRELAAAVYAWQDRLLPLTARAAARSPSASLWPRIERALGMMSHTRVPAAAKRGVSWWQRLAVWQALSAAAVAASLLLAVVLVQRGAMPDAPRYLTLLQSPDQGTTGWIVEMQVGGRLRLVPVAETAAVPEGRVLQFWTKPQAATAPTSLGLVRPNEIVELPASQLPAVEARQLFEITLEPQGGSPIGRPTGPILFVGRSVRF
jgi:anti-sigma-K factor RskA